MRAAGAGYLHTMDAAVKKMAEADHKRFVGESLALARSALGKRPVDWQRMYPTWITSAGKLTNWEKGDNYPPPLFLLRLCNDHGFTMDWFYRRRLAGVSDELADDLRRVEVGSAEASPAARQEA